MNTAAIQDTSRDLALRLIALESEHADEQSPPAFRVCHKLRTPLSTLMGANGYGALVNRALTLAKREWPPLDPMQAGQDGALKYQDIEAAAETGVLLRHIIALLLSFVGEAVTLRILHDVWPALRDSNTLGEME